MLLNKKYDANINSIIAVLLIFSGFLIVLVSRYYHLNQSYIGYAIIVGSVAYAVIKRKLLNNIANLDELNLSRSLHLLLCLCFFIMLNMSILLLRYTSEPYHRPLGYFVTISIACSLIGIQIFNTSNISNKKYQDLNVYFILLEIFVLSFYLRWSIYYLFPGVQGVDPWYHIGFIQEIINLGKIDGVLYSSYSSTPIMHSEITILKIITAMNIKNSYFMISIAGILITLFVFLIGKRMFGIKIGLLSTLILNMSDQFINFGIQITPMILGAYYFIILFYIVYTPSEFKKKDHIFLSSFCILIFTVIILTHTIATFVTSIILIISFLLLEFTVILNQKNKKIEGFDINLSIFLVSIFIIGFISYWIFAFGGSGHTSFFNNVVLSFNNAMHSSNLGDVELVTQASKLNSFVIGLNHLGYSFLLLFGIIGGMISITIKKYRNLGIVLSVISGVIIFWIYIPSLMGSNATLPHRWFLFLYPLLSILAAAGIYFLIQSIDGTNKKYKVILIFITLFLLNFFMITNSLTNYDSPIYPPDRVDDFSYSRSCYYESEINVGDFINSNYNGSIVTDYRYLNIMRYWYQFNNISFISIENPSSYSDGLILLRNSISKGFISDTTTNYMFVYKKTPQSLLDTLGSGKYIAIYNNGEVTMYLAKNTGQVET